MAALIVGAALIVAGFLTGGRYAVTVATSTPPIIYEVDRLTGAIRLGSIEQGLSFKCARSEITDYPAESVR